MGFDVAGSAIGHTKIDDGSTLNVRVTFRGIEEKEGPKLPTGPVFGVTVEISVVAESPQELKQRVASKPTVPQDNSHLAQEIWESQRISESKPAFEEVSYKASDGVDYLIKVEAEPTIVKRTLEYRDDSGNPVYAVRYYQKNSVALKPT